MKEQGKIIKRDGNQAVIEIEQGEQCKHCNACHMFGESKMRLTAYNGIDAQVGEHVIVYVQPGFVLKSSFLIFIFPLLAMFAGYFVGQWFTQNSNELSGIIGAFSGLILALLINMRFNQSAKSDKAEIISKYQQDKPYD